MGLFDGKVVIITGAGGGIGRAEALAFAREGARVVVNDLGVSRDGANAGMAMAEQVAAEIRSLGGEAVGDTHSVAETAGAEAIARAAVDSFGRLDVLVNNAGILRDKTILKMTDDEWDIVQAVHLRGSFLCLRAAGRIMTEQGTGGAIVNTSSTSGLLGNFGQGNYGAAKAGIAGLTRTAALELGKHGIRVNALVPVAKTRMTEDIAAVSGDVGPEWIPPLVLFLASDLATSVTGRVFGAEKGAIREYYYEVTPGINRDDRPWTPEEVAAQWKQVVKRDSGGPAIGAGDLEALILKGFPVAVDPAKARGWNARFHLNLIDGDGFTLVIGNGRCRTARGLQGQPTCVLTTDEATAYGLFRGEVDGNQAYMKGKLKISNVGDIMRFTAAYDPNRAKEAQAHAGGLTEVAEDLTPHGLNRGAAGAKLRGTASLASPAMVERFMDVIGAGAGSVATGAATPPLLGITWAGPLLGQALSALGEPEATAGLRTLGLELDLDSPIASNDLLYPIATLTAVAAHQHGDSAQIDVTLRRDGEVAQRQRLTVGVGTAAVAHDASSGPARWTTRLDLPEAAGGNLAALLGLPEENRVLAPPLALLARVVDEAVERELAGDPSRCRHVEARFFDPAADVRGPVTVSASGRDGEVSILVRSDGSPAPAAEITLTYS